MKPLLIIIYILSAFICSAQNYIGYNKTYIVNALKKERNDMTGPVVIKDGDLNFISYVSKDKKRAVFYHFTKMPVTLPNGKTSEEEICWKYVSKNMCRSNSKCPEMEKVIRSINSRFKSNGHFSWIDDSKKIPQEWLLVKEHDYFEVHVTEKKSP